MRVLITGSHGFIGKNLVCRLNEIDDIEIVEFNKEDDFSKIKDVSEIVVYSRGFIFFIS